MTWIHDGKLPAWHILRGRAAVEPREPGKHHKVRTALCGLEMKAKTAIETIGVPVSIDHYVIRWNAKKRTREYNEVRGLICKTCAMVAQKAGPIDG